MIAFVNGVNFLCISNLPIKTNLQSLTDIVNYHFKTTQNLLLKSDKFSIKEKNITYFEDPKKKCYDCNIAVPPSPVRFPSPTMPPTPPLLIENSSWASGPIRPHLWPINPQATMAAEWLPASSFHLWAQRNQNNCNLLQNGTPLAPLSLPPCKLVPSSSQAVLLNLGVFYSISLVFWAKKLFSSKTYL